MKENATATRPKTEREERLEARIRNYEIETARQHGKINSLAISNGTSESRVKELEARIQEMTPEAMFESVRSGQFAAYLENTSRAKELEIENNDLKRTIQDIANDISHHVDSTEEVDA